MRSWRQPALRRRITALTDCVAVACAGGRPTPDPGCRRHRSRAVARARSWRKPHHQRSNPPVAAATSEGQPLPWLVDAAVAGLDDGHHDRTRTLGRPFAAWDYRSPWNGTYTANPVRRGSRHTRGQPVNAGEAIVLHCSPNPVVNNQSRVQVRDFDDVATFEPR